MTPATLVLAGGGPLAGLLGPDIEFSITGALLIGLGVGFLVGLLGVGGGFLMVPLVNMVLGVPMSVVAGSSLCQIQGTGLSGLLRHRRQGNSDTQIAVLILGGTLCGTVAGVEIMEHLKGLGEMSLAGGSYPTVEVVLSYLFLVVLVLIGSTVMVESVRTGRKSAGEKKGPRRGLFARVRIPPYVTPAGGRPVPAVLVAYAGVIVGLLQALLGIGGGVLLLPILVYLVGLATHAAVGTSLMIVFAASIAGTFLHALNGNVSLPLVLTLLVGGTLGSQFGALASAQLASHKLRKYFALVVAAAVLIVVGKLGRMYGVISWGSARGDAEKPAVAEQKHELSFITYNVLADPGDAAPRAPALMKLLKFHDADVIALQEVAPWFLARLMGEPWTRDYRFEPNERSAPGGLLILSKLPAAGRAVYRPLPSRQGRGVLMVRLRAGGRTVAVATVHLESPLEAGPARARQLAAVFKLLKGPGADDAVLLGDFNFGDGEKPETAKLPTAFVDPWLRLKRGLPGYTWNIEKSDLARANSFPDEKSRRLDRLMVRSDFWRPGAVEIIGDRAVNAGSPALFPSDHFGLFAKIIASE